MSSIDPGIRNPAVRKAVFEHAVENSVEPGGYAINTQTGKMRYMHMGIEKLVALNEILAKANMRKQQETKTPFAAATLNHNL